MNIINNTNTTSKLFLSLFQNPVEATKAYNFLIQKGYAKEDISVIMSNETRDKYFANENMPEDSLDTKAIQGLGVGSAVGGTIGAIAAALAAIGTVFTIPALGFVIAGPIAAALAGAGAGSAIGGLTGALVGSEITDENVKEYEDKIKDGNILIGVKSDVDEFSNLQNELETTNL